jgi:hypothetical protein
MAALAALLNLGPRSFARNNKDTGDIDDDNSRVAQLTLNLPLSSVERIKAASARSGLSVAAYISASVGCARWNSTLAGAMATLELDGNRYLTQLPAPGLLTTCPCHAPTPDEDPQPNATGTLGPKITYAARQELKQLARQNRGGPLTMTEYVEAATWVEQWNYDHRHCRIVIDREDGRYEVLLPYAGIVQGQVITAS